MEIIAHRGYSCGTLDNTAKSVEYAWLAGADGVEVDLRVSRDGVVFLYHDDNVNGRSISKADYADIVMPGRPNAPALKTILDLAEPLGYFVLDLKESDPNKYLSLPLLIADSGIAESRFTIQSTNIATLVAMKRELPNAKYFYLSHLKRTFPFYRIPKPEKIMQRIEGLEFDGVSLKGRQFINEFFVQEFKSAGYRVNIWTINDPARGAFYQKIGVDGLITDFVEEIRSEVLDGRRFEGQCPSTTIDAG